MTNPDRDLKIETEIAHTAIREVLLRLKQKMHEFKSKQVGSGDYNQGLIDGQFMLSEWIGDLLKEDISEPLEPVSAEDLIKEAEDYENTTEASCCFCGFISTADLITHLKQYLEKKKEIK